METPDLIEIKVEKIPDDDGGGYTAYSPTLGENIFVGGGDTVSDALENLASIIRYFLENQNGAIEYNKIFYRG